MRVKPKHSARKDSRHIPPTVENAALAEARGLVHIGSGRDRDVFLTRSGRSVVKMLRYKGYSTSVNVKERDLVRARPGIAPRCRLLRNGWLMMRAVLRLSQEHALEARFELERRALEDDNEQLAQWWSRTDQDYYGYQIGLDAKGNYVQFDVTF